MEKFRARKVAEAAGGSDQPSLAEAVQGLADAVSMAQMSDLEKQVLLETWASEGRSPPPTAATGKDNAKANAPMNNRTVIMTASSLGTP